MCVGVGGEGRKECVYGCVDEGVGVGVIVSVCGCDCVGKEGSVCGAASIAEVECVHTCVHDCVGVEVRMLLCGYGCDCVGVIV